MSCIVSAFRRSMAAWRPADEGSVAIIFALVMIPILGIAATALDYGRASRVRTTISRAADAAVVEVATNLTRSDTAIEDEIRNHLDANLPKELRGLQFTMHIPAQRDFVEIEMETSVKTTLAGVLGVMKFDIKVHSRAERVEHPTNGKVTPEMEEEMERQLRWLYHQAQQSGAFGQGGPGGGGNFSFGSGRR